MHLLTIDEISHQWQGWVDNGPTPELDEDAVSVPPDYVQPRYFHRGWIPFTDDSGGNHLAIDLDPAEKGSVGQVIVFGRDDQEHYVLAHSFSDFLRLIHVELESGNYVIERNGDRTWYSDTEMIELNTKQPKVNHFHSAIADERFNILRES